MNFYTPFNTLRCYIQVIQRSEKDQLPFCNTATLITLKRSGAQGKGVGAVPGRLFESTNKTIHHLSTLGVGTGARAQYQNHKKLGNWLTFEKVMQSANAMTEFKVMWRTWMREFSFNFFNFLFSIRTLTSSSAKPNAGIARILSANLTRQCSFNIIMWIFL